MTSSTPTSPTGPATKATNYGAGYGFSRHRRLRLRRPLSERTPLLARAAAFRCGSASPATRSGSTDQYAGSGSTEWTESTDIIARQIDLSRQYENVDGIILFRYEQIFVSPNASMQVEKKNFTALLQ